MADLSQKHPAAPPHLQDNPKRSSDDDEPPAPLMIVGGGIVGLVLALALDTHLNSSVPIVVFESSPSFEPDVGAGMGLYANGLRVLRDISPDLFDAIRTQGYPFLERRWERHDGTEVCVAQEGPVLWQGSIDNEEEAGASEPEYELQTLGIRRWKFQQCLHDAVRQRPGITLNFGKRVQQTTLCPDGLVEVTFQDGSRSRTQFLLAADGSRSAVRRDMLAIKMSAATTDADDGNLALCPKLEYTGVTCIMGVAEQTTSSGEEPRRRGIAFPSSSTTRCHGCFYPTAENEDCFQFHFPIDAATKSKPSNQCGPKQQKEFGSSWGTRSQEVGRRECAQLADILAMDGWHEDKFLKPLRNSTHAVRVEFCKLLPPLEEWVLYDPLNGVPRIVLLGDAAHPPLPYIGQGAQMGLEDAGTLALLLQQLCKDDQGRYTPTNLRQVLDIYQKMRIPRAKELLSNAHYMGNMQQKRAENRAYNIAKEELIQRQVFYHETVPVYFSGARYDYRQATLVMLRHESTCLQPLREGNDEEEQREFREGKAIKDPTKQPRSILKKAAPSKVGPCCRSFVEQAEC